jgi:hypothetical protein
MYFPYMCGRRSELLAVRSFFSAYPSAAKVVPVIEPVVSRPNDLANCIKLVGEPGREMLVVVNPHRGELKTHTPTEWRQAIGEALKEYKTVVPTLRCGPATTFAQVNAFLSVNKGRSVALVHHSSILSDAELAKVAASEQVKYHLCVAGKVTAAQRALIAVLKAVDVHDRFNRQARNSDYGGQEPFSDHHLTFASHGIGFGDFSVIGSEYVPGGGKPGAVVIHAVYKKMGTGVLWLEHFLSDDTDIDTGDVASKYLQAANKLSKAVQARPAEFVSNPALSAYKADVVSSKYPGLGKNKERQILHHLSTMDELLI